MKAALSRDELDLEPLIQMCKDFCAFSLARAGRFAPFAALMTPTGSLKACRIPVGKPEVSAFELAAKGSQLLFQDLNAGRAFAVAIALHVRLPEEIAPNRSLGIRVDLNTVDEGRTFYIPYHVKRSGFLWRHRTVDLGELRQITTAPATKE